MCYVLILKEASLWVGGTNSYTCDIEASNRMEGTNTWRWVSVWTSETDYGGCQNVARMLMIPILHGKIVLGYYLARYLVLLMVCVILIHFAWLVWSIYKMTQHSTPGACAISINQSSSCIIDQHYLLIDIPFQKKPRFHFIMEIPFYYGHLPPSVKLHRHNLTNLWYILGKMIPRYGWR